jgi:hypothetical protein
MKAFSADRCSSLLAQLGMGYGERSAVISEIRGSVRRLTFDAAGCRVVQRAIEVAEQQQAAELAAELLGIVRRVIMSPHGNFVIQKIIEVLPIRQSTFIVAELIGAGAKFSSNRYGCRILSRIVEHSGSDSLAKTLIDEILQDVRWLLRDNFGHHVIESILEHGSDEQKHHVAAALQCDLTRNATDRHASYVIETALKNCSSIDRSTIIATLTSNPGSLALLASDRSGSYVLNALNRYTVGSV